MSIREQENHLFDEWKHNRNGFVSDGVVSEKDYLDSKPKIAFILKEVNDPDGGGWDLRELVAQGKRKQTWENVARWVDGIRLITNGEHIPSWSVWERTSESFRKDVLKSICVLNLKKSPGTHTSNSSSLEAVAREDKDYIRRQYELYDPDLTICCGTGGLFKEISGHKSSWEKTNRGIAWYERAKGKFVLSYSHPEARVYKPLLIYGLLDAVNEIYQ